MSPFPLIFVYDSKDLELMALTVMAAAAILAVALVVHEVIGATLAVRVLGGLWVFGGLHAAGVLQSVIAAAWPSDPHAQAR